MRSLWDNVSGSKVSPAYEDNSAASLTAHLESRKGTGTPERWSYLSAIAFWMSPSDWISQVRSVSITLRHPHASQYRKPVE